MLEIRSEWQEISAENGKKKRAFVLIMGLDGKYHNMAFSEECFNNPLKATGTVRIMIERLFESIYPELLNSTFVQKCMVESAIEELKSEISH
jgi:hypothetical protein